MTSRNDSIAGFLSGLQTMTAVSIFMSGFLFLILTQITTRRQSVMTEIFGIRIYYEDIHIALLFLAALFFAFSSIAFFEAVRTLMKPMISKFGLEKQTIEENKEKRLEEISKKLYRTAVVFYIMGTLSSLCAIPLFAATISPLISIVVLAAIIYCFLRIIRFYWSVQGPS